MCVFGIDSHRLSRDSKGGVFGDVSDLICTRFIVRLSKNLMIDRFFNCCGQFDWFFFFFLCCVVMFIASSSYIVSEKISGKEGNLS